MPVYEIPACALRIAPFQYCCAKSFNFWGTPFPFKTEYYVWEIVKFSYVQFTHAVYIHCTVYNVHIYNL